LAVVALLQLEMHLTITELPDQILCLAASLPMAAAGGVGLIPTAETAALAVVVAVSLLSKE
jgi:hypothetical protein